MALLNIIPQPIPFYDAPGKRHWSKRRCLGQHDQVFHQASDRYPNFIITRDSESANTWAWSIISEDGTTTALTAGFIQSQTFNGIDYIYAAPTSAPSLTTGLHYLTLTDGTRTYYSEWFAVSDCTDEMVHISWRDTCSKLQTPWAELPDEAYGDELPFAFHLWARTEIGEPVITSTETFQDTGAEEVRTSVITRKRYTLNDAAPEYIVECFHAMKHHDTVLLTDAEGGETTYTLSVDTITADYLRTGCVANLLALLNITGEYRGACCQELVECTTEAVATLYTTPFEDQFLLGMIISDVDEFTPVTINWSVNGVAQTPITYLGIGGYTLGYVEDGDVIDAYLVDENGCRTILGGIVPIAITCNMRQSVSLTLDDFGDSVGFRTSTGYVTIQDELGNQVIYGDGTAATLNYVDMTSLDADEHNWCVWASNVSGSPSGTMDQIFFGFNPDSYEAIDLSRVNDLEDFTLYTSPIALDFSNKANMTSLLVEQYSQATLDISDCVALVNFQASSGSIEVVSMPSPCVIEDVGLAGNAISDAANIDAIFNALDESIANGTVVINGGTNAAPTAASLTKRNALIANGWTITTN